VLVLTAGLGGAGAVGLARRRRGGALGARALGGGGVGLLGAAQAGGLLVEGGRGRLELGGPRLRAARPLDLGGRLVDGGPRGLGGEVPGGLAEPGELLAGQGVLLLGAGVRGLGGSALRLGGLDLLGADGVLGGPRRVGVLDRAADGAGVAVGEVDGELGGDPGEAATAQSGLGVGPLLRGAQGGGGLLVGGLDLLLLCRGGGDGLPAFLRGAQRETC